MKTREASLWRWLRGARCAGVHIERIENSLSRSTPDVEASVGAGGFWIELKTAARPKKPDTPVRFVFQPGQSAWLARRWKLDCAAWLLVQVGDARYLVAGIFAEELQAGVSEKNIATLAERPFQMTPKGILKAASDRLKIVAPDGSKRL